ncbi:WcaI family glycosyltransferase [Sphingomonas naphthae]|uniref:WcaI family glycosyltransferase n=1 Tax=Sphingomonas naphthae TaxID=1813468 RepID=A0ABY7TK66_9SPHN|nr:WcaI family glycosyltransferase [Sphingomonas naphthae]WCT73622.1 WcaI family glycosyltransferase [Sphingomonas naphthae]
MTESVAALAAFPDDEPAVTASAGTNALRDIRIHVITLNYHPEEIGIGPYSAEMAASFAAAGATVTVSSGKPFYPAWRIDPAFAGHRPHDRLRDGVAIRHHHIYVPTRPTGLKRIFHHLSFAAGILPHVLGIARRDRPDLIFMVAPSLISTVVGLLAARVSGARTWLHVQDFEVEAAFATGLLPGGLLKRLASAFERAVIRRCDRASSISPQMCAKLLEKGIAPDRVVEFRNWSDIAAIQPMAAPSPYRDEFAITTPYVALYSGNIANKQGIEILPRVARLLAYRTDLTFMICGDGPALANVRTAAIGLDNVRFAPLQPRGRLNELVGLADIHLLPQLAAAADLVLPSKLTNMLASGRPVVAGAEIGTALANEVEGAGLVVPPDDAQAWADAIEALLDDPDQAKAMGRKARHFAETRWAKDALLGAVQSRIATLVRG